MSTARSEADATDCQAVLLTGVYGSGKSSVAAETLALSVEHPHELDPIRSAVPPPLRVVRLVVDIETIERRCADDPTSEPAIDIAWARRWLDDGTGAGLEDFAVANDRPLPQVAAEVIDRLGW